MGLGAYTTDMNEISITATQYMMALDRISNDHELRIGIYSTLKLS